MGDVDALTPLTIIPLVAGAMCLTIGLVHLVLGLSRTGVRTHLAFAISALGISASTLLQPWVHKASTVEELRTAFRWMIGAEAIFWLAAIWFVIFYAGVRNRWLPWLVTGCFLVGLLFQVFSEGGVLFQEISRLNRVTLQWGEVISLPEGPASAWRIVTDAGLLGFFVIGILGCRQLMKGLRKRAVLMGVSLGCLLIGTVEGSLVDLGVLQTPYLFTYGYIGFVLIMSWELIGDVVRVSSLSRQVRAQEERWQTLCNRVRLAIVGLNPQGNISFVNPYFSELTGFEGQELLGRSWVEGFLPEPYREEARQVFHSRKIPDHFQSPILTKTGSQKTIAWSNVALWSMDGEFSGTLSIGADVTDRLEAEGSLKETIDELQKLKEELSEENISLLEEFSRSGEFQEIIGESPALNYVLSRIQEVAPTEATVLLEGETGVGKELMAQAIHARSGRSSRPLLKVDCTTLPPTLLESELFGYMKGAFTGADRARRGRFELADGGTIFLDEVGDLPLEIQPKLLRVLQEGKFERLGSEATTEVDVRIIAATNRDLKKEIADGSFRADLYFRLSVFPISVPPLRTRDGDIPLLIAHFVKKFAKKHGKVIETIPRGVLDELNGYDWPGNVRELQNVIERAVITAQGDSLKISETFQGAEAQPDPQAWEELTLEEVERRYILETLNRCSWVISGPKGAASKLGLHPNTLRSRMQKLGIRKPKNLDRNAHSES